MTENRLPGMGYVHACKLHALGSAHIARLMRQRAERPRSLLDVGSERRLSGKMTHGLYARHSCL